MAVKEKGCFYCDPDHQGRKDLMIEVGQMKEGVLYLFKDQAHLGRCVVAVPEHKSELFDLEPKQRHDYIDDVAAAARAIKKLWGCTKINYGAYGDKLPYLHFHLVPKYEGGFEFGGAFAIGNDEPKFLADEEYETMIGQLKKELNIK